MHGRFQSRSRSSRQAPYTNTFSACPSSRGPRIPSNSATGVRWTDITRGGSRKVDIRLPGKGNSNSHGARTVHQKHRWIRTSRLSIKNSLSMAPRQAMDPPGCYNLSLWARPPFSEVVPLMPIPTKPVNVTSSQGIVNNKLWVN